MFIQERPASVGLVAQDLLVAVVDISVRVVMYAFFPGQA